MGILAWIVFGFVVGLIARAIIPGPQKLGLILTTLVGIGGSFVGGMVGSIFSGRPLYEFNTAGIVGSVIGAIALMFLLGLTRPRRV
jgi:uncharacterized membrane protein YeaQ/YmgE (transglycosylase-associated protein family)